MIELVVFSFFAGVLTILAPCILPLIPVIIGASTSTLGDNNKATMKRPLTIVLSLITSIVLFTLLLKATTALLGLPNFIWPFVSGIIILLFGVNILFPTLWKKVVLATNIHLLANKHASTAQEHTGIKRDILLGAALGPVFNSCSPTYALIVAVLLPASFGTGLVYLLAYSVGLGSILLLIVLFGNTITSKMRWMSNPHGVFQRLVGVFFIVVGIMIIFGLDKQIQTAILDSGAYKPIESIERKFIDT